MTPHGGKGKEPFTFMPKTPHFFKIILQGTLDDQKLMIPVKFVKNHGEHLQNQAVLKVPSGETWKVELRKCDGKVWLEKGWKEFADYYSLAHGHFLVFEYRRSPDFYVLIFDNTATEIDYSLISSRRNDHELPPQEGEDAEDDKSVDILDDCSFFKKKRGRSPLQSPRPRKITKADSTTKTSGKRVLGGMPMTMSQSSLEKQMGTGQRSVQRARIVGTMNQLTNSEKAIAMQRASSFKSKNPFFKVVMQPYFVGKAFKLGIPIGFARTYFSEKKGRVTFNGPQGRTWFANYRINEQARIYPGWREFAQDNYLRIGDVCVFELIDSKEILFNVVIFRITDKNLKNQQLQEGKRDVGSMSATKVHKLTNSEKTLAVKRASSFESKNPFCKVVMQSNSVSKQFKLVIPVVFARKYFPEKKGKVTFNGPHGRTWSGKYCFSEQARIGAGWKNFAQDNYLQIGDVCVFELIDSKEILLNVVIFRVREENLKNHQFQGDESQRFLNSDAPRRVKPLTAIEKANVFKSKNPFFSVVMEPSYVHNRCNPNIPYKFAKEYFKENSGEVTLRVLNGRAWTVKYKFDVFSGQPKACLYSSWVAFMKDNNLRVGDVCVFELMKGIETSLQVSIFRRNEEANCRPLSISLPEYGKSSVVYGYCHGSAISRPVDAITSALKLEEQDMAPGGPITRSKAKKLALWIEAEMKTETPHSERQTLMVIEHHSGNQGPNAHVIWSHHLPEDFGRVTGNKHVTGSHQLPEDFGRITGDTHITGR